LNTKILKRRGFVKICASAVASVSASPGLLASTEKAIHRYNRVKLVGLDGAPLSLTGLVVGETYVFNYPYVTTPCFLLNLGNPAVDGQPLEPEAGEKYASPLKPRPAKNTAGRGGSVRIGASFRSAPSVRTR
jgi:hypothetical protein